ncbi:hypothetical protein AA313_de0208246 [Arthrobotrys entomopaga]|nr:hypothetical protein AA313_de0208246 [Arthrobotrys entomopaga]
MPSITYKSILVTLFLAIRASGYTINFYTDTDCKTSAVWQHTVVNDTSVGTLCEVIPKKYIDSIQVLSASLTSDSLDPYPGYTLKLFTDEGCLIKSNAKLGLADNCVNFYEDTVLSFRVAGKLSSNQLPYGVTSSSATTEDVTTDGYGDALVTQTETDEVAYDDSGFGADLSPGSDSSQAAGVMYPFDNSNPAAMGFPASEAAIPGSADEEDCDDTQTDTYLQDSNNDGTADGYVSKTTMTDDTGNVVGYDRIQVDYGQNIPGATMRGPTVAQDPTLGGLGLQDAGIDYGMGTVGSSY